MHMECSIFDDEVEKCWIMCDHLESSEPWYSVLYNGMGYVVKVKDIAPIMFRTWRQHELQPKV